MMNGKVIKCKLVFQGVKVRFPLQEYFFMKIKIARLKLKIKSMIEFQAVEMRHHFIIYQAYAHIDLIQNGRNKIYKRFFGSMVRYPPKFGE